jgi:DNA phosphorothioation-associated putative methyltransferase
VENDLVTAIGHANNIGKKVGGALYLHMSALAETKPEYQWLVKKAQEIASIADCDFNVVKLQRDKVSLLLYEKFSESAFPALLDAHTVDLKKQKASRTNYRNSENPPILHRKELLLPHGDTRRPEFEALTKSLEQLGLFDDNKSIGRRRQWTQRLDEAGIKVVGTKIVRENTGHGDAPTPVTVSRHKTALSRQGLSTPMQALVRHGLLDDEVTVFDYGCGQGDDLAALRAAGITANGWDPHFFPNTELKKADIVNLGFVLNVIETPAERVAAAKNAFSLTAKFLIVAVMLHGKGRVKGLRPHNDGFLTSRGTFQKYFLQADIKQFLQDALKQEAIALGPGLFVIFRDKLAEQNFLSNRHRRARDVSHFLTLLDSRSGSSGNHDNLLICEHADLLEDLWAEVLKLGRLPDPDELANEFTEQLLSRLGSIRSAVRLAQVAYGADALKEARTARIDDLRVYFALNLFSRRQPYQQLSSELQRDIKGFFGSYQNAVASGKELLYSVGDTATILQACEQAKEIGLGHLDGQHSLQIDSRLASSLPAALRVYIGCGEILYGDAEEANIVKVHIRSGKLSLLKFDDFLGSPLPRLVERIKIRLRDQDIEFFEYGDEYPSPLLYLKSRFMSPDQKEYRKQKLFDDTLFDIDTLDFSGYGPAPQELNFALVRAKKSIKGFSLIDIRD